MAEEFKNEPDGLRTYQGAVAIITGGTSGIGRALAEALAENGASVIVLIDRQEPPAQAVAGLRVKGATTRTYQADVRDFEAIKQAVTETVQAYGRLDYMFNNAGTSVAGPLDEIGVDDFNYVLDVNIRGVSNGVLAAYPIMKEQGFGHIVNTASVAGLFPNTEGFTLYATSKCAVVGLSTNLRVEAARHGVHVSVLCPGVIDTPLLKNCGKYGKNLSNIPQDVMDSIFEKFPVMDPKQFATRALKSVARNGAIIVIPGQPYKFFWFLYRMSPSLGLYLTRKNNEKTADKLKKILAERKND